ncbi:Protein FAR1-RELATED SEQUENCE 5 [Ananas comosus]|uniref:Protein FAR1-RELATED SEQUENCE n=1 Tax=Ananas comosus TaxID=4615 RepID=A0A199ULI5_ANACO|nr:Protein FAR1-RELATED SEQUENCE 5 [Ananas comosus]
MQYTRTGCKAHIQIKMTLSSKWKVTRFVKEHNHVLIDSPSKSRFLTIPTLDDKATKRLGLYVNSQIMSFIAAREGGAHNVRFTRKDLNNVVTEKNRLLLEFEMRWIGMLQKFDLYDNKHLQLMWNNRHQWVPVYFRDTFFAAMCTSQRSESINTVTKIWVDNHTSIYKFVLQIEKVVETRYDKEDEKDYKMEVLYSYDPIEVQARDIYTKRNFFEFKEQLRLILGHSLLELEKNSLYKKGLMQLQMFEFMGLLCSHILKVLHYIGIYSIPSHYILKRRTKNAQRRSFNIQSIQHEAMGDSVHAKVVHQGAKSVGSFELTC